MEYVNSLVLFGAVYVILMTSYALIAGLGRQFLISQAAMWGTGAYAYGIASTTTEWPTWLCALIGVAAGALSGAVIAVTAIRVSGVYLAITSFAFQIVFVNVLQNLEITGGQSGLAGIRPAPEIGGLDETESAVLLAVLACLLVLGIYRIWHGSAFGLVVRALGEDPQVLQGLGVRPAGLKFVLISLSGAIAGLAGVFYAQYMSYVDSTTFDIHVSITLLSMLIVGGSRTVLGPALGALFYLLIPQVLARMELDSAIAADLQQIVFALLLLAFLFFRPEGLLASRRAGLRAARRRRHLPAHRLEPAAPGTAAPLVHVPDRED